jgi:hypothetical protein
VVAVPLVAIATAAPREPAATATTRTIKTGILRRELVAPRIAGPSGGDIVIRRPRDPRSSDSGRPARLGRCDRVDRQKGCQSQRHFLVKRHCRLPMRSRGTLLLRLTDRDVDGPQGRIWNARRLTTTDKVGQPS